MRVGEIRLTVIQLGHANDDIALATEGRNCYGQALRELQKALYDERLMWHDETLVGAFILSIYEVSLCGENISQQFSPIL